MKKSTTDLIHELLTKVSKIKLNDASTILGGSSMAGATLNELRAAVASLQEAVSSGQSYESIMEQYEVLAGNIDTAGVTGLISESEIEEYYTLSDNIWAAIERDK